MQSRFGDLHSVLSLVGSEERISQSCYLTELCLLQLGGVLLKDFLGSSHGYFSRTSEEDITEGCKDLLSLQCITRHAREDFGEGLPIEDAEGVGYTILQAREGGSLLLA